MTSRKVGIFELIDHGIRHDKNFWRRGVALTSFSRIVTGIGDNPTEAIVDCLIRIARRGFDVGDMLLRIMAQRKWDVLPIVPSVTKKYKDDEADKVHYYVSIRWNEKM